MFKKMNDIINNIFHNYLAKGNRSTVLQPLLFIFGALLFCVSIASWYGNQLLIYIFAIMLIILFVIIIVVYFYCFFKNPDLIRSESYLIQKTYIETFKGDDKVRLKPNGLTENKLLGSDDK